MNQLEMLVTELLARLEGEKPHLVVRALSCALSEIIADTADDDRQAAVLAELAAMHMKSGVACILNGCGRDLYERVEE